MSAPSFPLHAVAALFIERQHLDRPRGRRFTEHSLTRFVEDTGGLQIDSINVVERAHYLTAWSRFGPYPRTALDRIAYRRRALFEYWAHAACLVSLAHYGPWKRAMLDYRIKHRGWSSWLRKNQAVVRKVEETIRANGPVGNAHFEHKRAPGERGGWWNWKPAMFALDYLWMSGITLVHSRPNFQKRFDLAERLIPSALELAVPSPEEFRRWHIRQCLHAMGAATEIDLRRYLTFPRFETSERRRALAELLESGEVVEIGVEHAGQRGSATRAAIRAGSTSRAARWLALAEDLPALEAAARRRRAPRGTTLLSPFDSFLWHRDRTRRLFGFDYTIEVYTPGHKRVHGYYTLPIFHDGQLIGRVDPKNHRAERRLEVKGVSFEPWFARGGSPPAAAWGPLERDAALAGIGDSLRSLAAFVGAERITLGRVSPSRLRTPLNRALASDSPSD